MYRVRVSKGLRLVAAFFLVCVWACSSRVAHAETVWNADFLRKLPRVSTPADLDRLLDQLSAEPDQGRATASPAEPFLYPLQPFKGGYTPLLLEDAAGKLEKYAVWLERGANGRYEKLVLVRPTLHDRLFEKEGYIPFDATLKKKIMNAKGITAESDYQDVMKSCDTSGGRIMLRCLVTADLLGHYLENGHWSGTRADPAIEAQYQQLLTFTNATSAAHDASPRAIVSVNAVAGSRITFFEYQ